MTEVTVAELAEVVGAPIDILLKQMQEAGLSHKRPDEPVSDQEKLALLDYLKRSHTQNLGTSEQEEVTLRRKSVSKVKVVGSTGKNKVISVEVRKKRSFVAPKKVSPESSMSSKDSAKNSVQVREDVPQQDKVESQETRKSSKVIRKELEDARRKAEDEKRRKVREKPGGRKWAKSSRRRDQDFDDERSFRGTGKGRKGAHQRGRADAAEKNLHAFQRPTTPVVRTVSLGDSITVADLAQEMAVKAADVIKLMFKMGSMVSINQTIDRDTAQIVVEEMGHKAKLVSPQSVEDSFLELAQENQGERIARAPVVTVMGHVDHGKTSLLDCIRRSQVAQSEAGGITQHIGAYHVETERGAVSFLDTPGHAAFTAMRARGTQLTDVVVLVVAADDGVMPQTLEAIQHAKAGNVPLVVAVNKMDKSAADPDRIKNELVQAGVVPEAWGGDTQFIEVSAHTGKGVDALLEAIILQAELLELEAYPEALGQGVVIESRLDKGRGPVASILVQNGTLKKGDHVLVGQYVGRVRAMLDENGVAIESAGPSTPVEILGLDGTPDSGDELLVVKNEKKAREIALFRQGKSREVKLARQIAGHKDNILVSMGAEAKKTLKIVLKTDVRGSLEALTSALHELGNDEVQVKVISEGVGAITETDASLALASEAMLIGFNVRADAAARQIVKTEGILLRYYSVIYNIIDDVKQALGGMLGTDLHEQILGVAEVRDVFRSSKLGVIAGCMVLEGSVYRNQPIRVLRDEVVIYEGELESLRRYKEDVNEVRNGIECGIGVKNYNDVKVGDKIEVYKSVSVQRTL